jgi:hypothetical protein
MTFTSRASRAPRQLLGGSAHALVLREVERQQRVPHDREECPHGPADRCAQRCPDLGFGRIVASETEVPNILANLVWCE